MYTSPTSLFIHPIRHTTHNSNRSCGPVRRAFTTPIVQRQVTYYPYSPPSISLSPSLPLPLRFSPSLLRHLSLPP